MTIEQSALDLVAENKMLSAENKELNNEVDGYRNRVCSMCDGHGLVGNCLDSIDCPDCTKVMDNIKADAVEEFANEYCGDCKTIEQSAWSYYASSYSNRLRRGKG